MVENNNDSLKTAYTISLDYAHGTSTGISAHDRAATVRAMAAGKSAQEFTRPGHVFPLRYTEGGVLKRVGHTEASVDFCKLTGKQPVAVISEVVSLRAEVTSLKQSKVGVDEREIGGMARRDELKEMCREWGIKICSISDLRKYRLDNGFLNI